MVTKYRHICESCGKEEVLTSDQGFEKGWDYPPRMGAFGVISPRTCGSCPITTTLWWRLQSEGLTELSKRDADIAERIRLEPASIVVEEPDKV